MRKKIEMINKLTVDGISPLLEAASRRDVEMVRILMSYGAKFETPESYKIIKGMGHLLGLSTSISINIDSKEISVKTESETTLRSFLLLDAVVKKYSENLTPDTEQSKQFEIISEAIGNAKEYLKLNEQVTAEALCDRFKSERYTVVPTGWTKHVISVVLYKDYLVVVNRGDREAGAVSKERTLIYKIPDKNSITPEFIKNLNPIGDRPSKKIIMDHIRNIVGVGPEKTLIPFVELPTKDQRHGTCSFVNPKGGVEAILFLKRFEDLMQQTENPEDIEEIKNIAKTYAREEYKKFTNDIRNQGIAWLIEFREKAYSENNEENKNIAIQLAVAVIREHHGEEKYSENQSNKKKIPRKIKIKQELKREFDLLTAFSAEEQKQIIQDVCSRSPPIDLLYPALRKQEKDHDELIELLLKLQVNVDADHLLFAVENGYAKTVQALLKLLPESEIKTKEMDDALYEAGRNGDAEIVQVLLEVFLDPETKTEALNIALESAVSYGHPKLVQILLSMLPDSETKIKILEDKLWWAVEKGQPECLEVLLSAFPDSKAKIAAILSKDPDTGNTMLIVAAREGYTNVVEMLLAELSDAEKINAIRWKNQEGDTATTIALKEGFPETARVLEAALEQELEKQKPPSELQIQKLSQKLRAMLGEEDILGLQTFLKNLSNEEKIAVLNKTGSDGWTVLMRAAFRGQTATVQAILGALSDEQKVEVLNKTDSKGKTAFMLAILFSKTATVQAILESFSSDQRVEVLNKTDLKGRTALMRAASRRDPEMVRILTSYGAKFVIPDPYKIIKEMGHLLGLSTSINLDAKETSVETEFNRRLESFLLLDEVVEKYSERLISDTEQSKHFEIISEAIGQTKEYLKFNEEVTAEILCDRFKAEKCTIIPTGWPRHAISIVLYKDYLVVVNRGDREKGDESKERTLIYKIPDKNAITPDFIKNLNPKGDPPSKEIIMGHIRDIVGVGPEKTLTPFVELPTKDQKHGTCSFVNPKGGVEAILFLEKLEELKKLPEYVEAAAIENAKKYAREEYKKFTNDIRNQGVSKLIDFREKACSKNNEENKKVAIQLAVAVMIEHHGEEKYSDNQKQLPRKVKIAQELKREFDLLKAFSSEERKQIIQEIQSKPQFIDLLYPALSSKGSDRDELIEFLLESGVKIKSEHLSLAAEKGDLKTVQAFLAMPSDSKTKIELIAAVLQSAARNGRTGVIETLLAALPDIEKIVVIRAKNKNGDTAISLARRRMDSNTIRVLELALERALQATSAQAPEKLPVDPLFTPAFQHSHQKPGSELEKQKPEEHPKSEP